MIVEIFPGAEADIVRQFRYYLVDQDTPAVAFRFRDAVTESVQKLKLSPRLGVVFEGSAPKLRSWPIGGFPSTRIYYREISGRLQIIRILHGKRNVRRILKQEILI